MQASIRGVQDGRAGRITIHLSPVDKSLNRGMCAQIKSLLSDWIYDPCIEIVIIERNRESRDFCASKTAVALNEMARFGGLSGEDPVEEYLQLAYMIATYPKPCIGVSDGITLDTGLAVTLHCSHHIVTDQASFSFPETGFGFGLYGGASHVLSRLPGEIGTWLALTGTKLQGREILAAGLASHFCDANKLEGLLQTLTKKGGAALERSRTVGYDFVTHRTEIDNAFEGSCVKSMVRRLQSGSKWAKTQATKLRAKSPLSAKIAIRQLRTAEMVDDVRIALKLEYRVTTRLSHSYNFTEGIRAQFQDKDYWPEWKPCSLVGTTSDMVAKYFAPLPNGELHLSEFQFAQTHEVDAMTTVQA